MQPTLLDVEFNEESKNGHKLSAFINFKSDVFDISRSSMNNVNDNEKQDDFISRTAIEITKNTDIQDNFKLRLELQREVGVITPFVNGNVSVT